MSLLIGEAKDQGKLLGIKFSSTLVIIHILFIDDVVIFGQGTYEEWRCYKSIITLFSIASGMMISLVNSSFLYNNLKDELDRKKIPCMTDVHCACWVPPCRGVVWHFVQQWNFAKRNKASHERATPPLVPYLHMIIEWTRQDCSSFVQGQRNIGV